MNIEKIIIDVEFLYEDGTTQRKKIDVLTIGGAPNDSYLNQIIIRESENYKKVKDARIRDVSTVI